MFKLRVRDIDWWFWLVIGLAIAVGLAGWRHGYLASAGVSAINLVFYVIRDRSVVSFPVQVRVVWLVFVLAALWPPLWWFNIALFVGMVLVVLFDRCGIARVLVRMPWNREARLTD
jgi:hypothetical protein